LPSVIDEAVVPDLVHVSREAGLGLVALAGLDDADPDFLEQLRRRLGIAALAEEVAVEGALVAAVQGFERRDVALRVPAHQLRVVSSSRHGRQHKPAGPAGERFRCD
jgi:hypothetical protein